MQPKKEVRRSGIILLVVLSMLTFFSLLVAAYLVFSSQSLQASFATSTRNIKQPPANAFLDEALMTLLRGPDDPTHPFFGEDLLSDYYGRFDFVGMRVRGGSTATGTNGFITVSVEDDPSVTGGLAISTSNLNDIYAGRVITFLTGNHKNRSYRVLRSISTAAGLHDLIFEQGPDLGATQIAALDKIRMNGIPRNSVGVGFNGTNIDNTTTSVTQLSQARNPDQPFDATTNPYVGYPLSVSLQPNHLGRQLDKSLVGGDFDEAYDAADFNNWFLSYRHSSDKIIPSFHRPSVINYILNGETNWTRTSAPLPSYPDVMASFSRGTFRPIPMVANQLGAGQTALHQKFTGGNENFALRTSYSVNSATKLNQLVQVLTGNVDNPWDVDNDGDGINDSIWIDLGLPVFTSPEGKLLKPLIAPSIEDLSARLNINAHHNQGLGTAAITAGATTTDQALFAGKWDAIGTTGTPTTTKPVFRGLGYGPAEISFAETVLASLVNDRYQSRVDANIANAAPGTDPADALSVLTSGYQKTTHAALGGFGYPSDPFGRGGVGIGRSGHLVAALSGLTVNGTTNEAVNVPYESDPTGELSGDLLFTHDDLEGILRANDFDVDLLSPRLSLKLQSLLSSKPELARALTTISVSDDTPPPAEVATTPRSIFESLRSRLSAVGDAAIPALIAPELRLGHKLDINRRFGNLVDDDNDNIIDEPFENETEAFVASAGSGQTVPAGFSSGVTPDYSFGSTVTGRELLARHLYVLMMALTDPGYNFPVVNSAAAPPASYRARRIAQWAINVVDYRDPDSIMTRFVFDPNPFDAAGWDPSTANPPPQEFVVWGVESPELMFSESAAFHDIRVRDTREDDDTTRSGDEKFKEGVAMAADPNTDQVRVPQGSLFLELYCPRPAVVGDQSTKPGSPRELFDINASGVSQLDLERRAPLWDTSTSPPTLIPDVGAPVWRIALSEQHRAGSASAAENPETMRTATLPDNYSFEPATPNELTSAGATALPIERYVLFQNFGTLADIQTLITDSGISDMNASQVFFVPGNDTREGKAINVNRRYLDAGQYLVLAPRETTLFGSRVVGGVYPSLPSFQRLAVSTTGLAQYNISNNLLTPTLGPNEHHTAALPLVVATFPPAGWPANAFEDGYVGLNISEPLPRDSGGAYTYYPVPLDAAATPTFRRLNGAVDSNTDGNIDYPLFDAYLDHDDPTNMKALDVPLDISTGRIPATGGAGAEPILGTADEYSSAFLQRLANPALPYDAITNPYRTVDWITLDLTIFSGEERPSAAKFPQIGNYFRSTRQRDGHINGAPADALYSYSTATPPGGSMNTTSESYFAFNGDDYFYSSLSFLNTATTGTVPSDASQAALGHSNEGFSGFTASIGSLGAATTVVGHDRNLPQHPFLLHPWLNRPYASHFELLMVPACSQGRLFEEFSPIMGGVDPAVYPTVAGVTDINVFRAPYRHLLNFFHSAEVTTNAANFVKLFDYVHTLPRFRGEVDMILPSRISGNLTSLFTAPFNFSYDNRRQGRLNLNTISEFSVWRALMQGHMVDAEYDVATGATTTSQLGFTRFKESRRGFPLGEPQKLVTDTTGGPYNYVPTQFNSAFPTEFAGVFKDALSANQSPNLRTPTPPPPVSPTDYVRRRPANATLLRSQGDFSGSDPDEGGAAGVGPFFVRNVGGVPTWDLAPTPPTNAHLNRHGNPFLRFQTLMRMPNLVSDNSQTFLVRLTMGFFEVDAANTNSLGTEYKESTGENQRFKAMFIIDRSIPVGFVPGQDVNVRDTVIFERFYQ